MFMCYSLWVVHGCLLSRPDDIYQSIVLKIDYSCILKFDNGIMFHFHGYNLNVQIKCHSLYQNGCSGRVHYQQSVLLDHKMLSSQLVSVKGVFGLRNFIVLVVILKFETIESHCHLWISKKVITLPIVQRFWLEYSFYDKRVNSCDGSNLTVGDYFSSLTIFS